MNNLSGVNYYYANNLISNNTGSMKLFYDFEGSFANAYRVMSSDDLEASGTYIKTGWHNALPSYSKIDGFANGRELLFGDFSAYVSYDAWGITSFQEFGDLNLPLYYSSENGALLPSEHSSSWLGFINFGTISISGISGRFIPSMESGNKNLFADISFYINGANQVDNDVKRRRFVERSGAFYFSSFNTQGEQLKSCATIRNGGALYSGNAFSFVLEGGKISKNDAKEVYQINTGIAWHNKEILFSNISGSGQSYNGWEFGLNAANLFYFRTSDDSVDKTFTYEEALPPAENFWIVRYIPNSIEILRYDPDANSINGNSFQLSAPISNGGNWTLGSGQNSNMYSLDTGIAGNETSCVKLKKFFYFDEALSDTKLKRLIVASKSDLVYASSGIGSGISYTIGEPYEECFVTSGILYTTGVLSGYRATEITVSGNPMPIALSGSVYFCEGEGSLDEWQTCQPINSFAGYSSILTGCSGLFYSTSYITGALCDLRQVVTGVMMSGTTSGFIIYEPVYISSGVSGVIASGCETIYPESGAYYEISGSSYVLTGTNFSNLGYKSLSYLGPRDDFIDIVEIITGNTAYRSGDRVTSVTAFNGASNYLSGQTSFIDLEFGESKSSVCLYLTGDAMQYGRDYTISGYTEVVFGDRIFGDIASFGSIYDKMVTGFNIQALDITGFNQYSSGSYSALPIGGRFIFLDGRKLISGVDYTGSAGSFAPTYKTQQYTGHFFSFDKLDGKIAFTGQSGYNIYVTGSDFLQNHSVAYWINGKRVDESQFVYHDIGVDLLTGVTYVIGTGISVEGTIEV